MLIIIQDLFIIITIGIIDIYYYYHYCYYYYYYYEQKEKSKKIALPTMWKKFAQPWKYKYV